MRSASLLVAGVFLIGAAPYDDASAQQKKRARHADNARSAAQIACTPTGCAAIPAGCRIETGFTQDGMLSGYDAVLCPVR